LFRQSAVTWPERNLVISPLSVAMALAMTYNGAGGGTREAMQQTLQLYGMTDEEVNESFGDLIGLLTHLDGDITASIANSVWLRQGFPVNDTFLQVNHDNFDARVADLDFSDAGAADTINAWVAEQTHDKIPTIVRPPLDPQLMMLLVNAVYLKGIWTHQFDTAATAERPFHTAAGGSVSVPFMKLDADLGYHRTERYQAVELPYGEGDFSMLLVLPNRDIPIASFIDSLTVEFWNELVAGLVSGSGHVFLPRFTTTCDLKLSGVLADLGMGVAFQPANADFSGISRQADLCLGEVIHKTYVAVDEEGTEAAAVTGVTVRLTSINPNEFTITFDRPFLFAIREQSTGSLLFLGRVMDPSAE
jgi:serpin B